MPFKSIAPEPEEAVEQGDADYSIDEHRMLFEAKHGKHERTQSRHKHIHIAGIVMFWLFIAISSIVAIIWVLHIILPTDSRFLDETEIKNLSTILLSVVGSSYFTGFAKNWLDAKS